MALARVFSSRLSYNWRSASQRLLSLYGRQQGRQQSQNAQVGKYDPPNGFLFNEKPLLPGEKRVKEPWEHIYIYGLGFTFLLAFVLLMSKPTPNIEKWAKQKAREQIAADEAELATEE